jgi:hypothetical protein
MRWALRGREYAGRMRTAAMVRIVLEHGYSVVFSGIAETPCP